MIHSVLHDVSAPSRFAGRNRAKVVLFRIACICVLVCCSILQVMGQLTARGADGKTATLYTNTPGGNRDTIFVFNQMPQAKKGNLSLRQPVTSTFSWYRFNYVTKKFADTPFATITNATATAQDTLSNSGYKVTVTPSGSSTPSATYVAWIYLNPGFNFKLYKDDNGELMRKYKSCTYTDFYLDPGTPTNQSSFTYYNPNGSSQTALVLDNRIVFTMRRGSASETVVPLNTQGKNQYMRDSDPPHEDMQYYFRANDMFGIEKKDDIKYTTIIPYVTLSTPVLPDVDPTSAPVPVKFTCQPNKIDVQNSEYIWRFGNGDSVLYDVEHTPPDTIKYTYFTPKSSGYQVTLKVIGEWGWGCVYTTPPVKITVDNPQLEVANVFTPNGDNVNDYFKPITVSLRQFEISIFTRAGKRVYHYKGNDLRSWIGWDGRIENSGNEAAEGVYFYVVKGVGWDEPPTTFDDKSRKNNPPQTFGGSFHLYR